MAQLATFGVERTSRPSGRRRGRRRPRAIHGSRRCSTRSPHTIASKEAGSSGSSMDSTSPTRTSAQYARAGLGSVGIELDADDPCTRGRERRREVAGRAADVQHVARAVGERQGEEPGMTALWPLVQRDVPVHQAGMRSTIVEREGSVVRIVRRLRKNDPRITCTPSATSVNPIAVAYS